MTDRSEGEGGARAPVIEAPAVEAPAVEQAPVVEQAPAVKVGVLLDRAPGRIGDWLADAAAFDAGGADALWIDPDPEQELDVLALAAAVAVLTFRARLVVALPAGVAATGRTIDTIARLSQNRLAVLTDADHDVDKAVLAVSLFRRVAGEPGVFEGAEDQRWTEVPVPQGRQAWRAECAAAAERGADGLVVPADPRMLDILRNPDEPGDRHDLQIAQG